ncbi:MAG: hypothetical protein KAK00_05360 [Nanoarchaeota archaeon]|nr:hypothetical protein [Nanoarchaeota archaeon]
MENTLTETNYNPTAKAVDFKLTYRTPIVQENTRNSQPPQSENGHITESMGWMDRYGEIMRKAFEPLYDAMSRVNTSSDDILPGDMPFTRENRSEGLYERGHVFLRPNIENNLKNLNRGRNNPPGKEKVLGVIGNDGYSYHEAYHEMYGKGEEEKGRKLGEKISQYTIKPMIRILKRLKQAYLKADYRIESREDNSENRESLYSSIVASLNSKLHYIAGKARLYLSKGSSSYKTGDNSGKVINLQDHTDESQKTEKKIELLSLEEMLAA